MLLKSLNYWSVPGGLDNTLDPVEFMRIAKKHRFPAVELAIGEQQGLCLDSDEKYCANLLHQAKEIGVQVASVASGLYWNHAVGDTDPKSRQIAEEQLEKMIRIASWLKVKTLLFIPGSVDVFFLPNRKPQRYDEVLKNATESIEKILPGAEEARVQLGIENVWNKFLLSPLEMAQFIDSFDSEWIGAYVDVGNVAPYGYPEQWLRILDNRVVGIHFKDFRKSVGTADGFVDLLEGDLNWPEVMAAIKDIGYDGPVVAEMIPCYQHFAEVRVANTSNAMDALLGLL